LRPHQRKIEIISGLLLIGMGILLLTDQIIWISAWAQRRLALTARRNRTPPTLWLSSPVCFPVAVVLPLVPAYLGYLGDAPLSKSCISTPGVNLHESDNDSRQMAGVKSRQITVANHRLIH
jgi:hypothetical protein